MPDGHNDAARRSDGAPGPERPAEEPSAHSTNEYVSLWFALARRQWSSVVLVPAEPGASTERVARALAEVGQRLSDGPVTAIAASSLDFGTAAALSELPLFVDCRRAELPQAPVLNVRASPAGEAEQAGAPDPQPSTTAPGGAAIMVSSAAQIVISIPAVVSSPLGLATTRNADLVVLCVELGRTKLANVRRTADLIGRERIVGCVLLE